MRAGLIAVALALLSATAQAQIAARRVAGAVAGGGNVNLPYVVHDNSGNQWMIYQQGWLRMQGNQPLYSQAATLSVNGNGMSSRNNQGRIDEKTGEVIVDGNVAGVNVSRRILVNREEGYVRYVDVFRNPGAQEVSLNIQLNTNFNYGVQSAQDLVDPKSKKQIGWAAYLHANRAIFELYAGKGSKVIPQVNGQQNNNVCQANMQFTVPANGQVAVLHLHGASATTETASQFIDQLKEAKLIADLPLEIRKIIINMPAMQSIGDREVLRGELFDVIELRGGDVLNGTIVEQNFKLETFYGVVELPADRIVGLINVGQFKPRQLLVTVDGEVFGGLLGRETIAIQLSSGQTTQVPLSQISRFGYRKRTDEPEEWTFDKPMVRLRSGERMLIAMPAEPYAIMTRYGLLKLQPQSISSIAFQSEEHGVHTIELTDGSRFAGLVSAEQFPVQLVGTATQQAVSFPAATMLRLQFAPPGEVAGDAPVLTLTNQDEMVGTLAGQLMLDTLFDTITINAAEMRGLSHAPDAGLDVQVTLWDQTVLSGQLRESEVTCDLRSGVAVRIPVPLIQEYINPAPKPSSMMIDRIKSVVAELSADDWKQRERAEAQLVSMGPIVVGVLRELSGAQSPEAQQRIDSVIKQLEKSDLPLPATPGRVMDE